VPESEYSIKGHAHATIQCHLVKSLCGKFFINYQSAG